MRRKIKALSIALVGVTAALVAVMAAVSLDLRRQLDLVATAKTDNIHWDVLQTEAEYLRLQTALIEAELRGGPALFQLRHRFDIFYSRVLLIEQGNIFERLRDVPSFEKNLSHLRDYLNETVPLIDGADAKLIAEIPRLEETTAALNKEVRALVVTGVTHFATVTDNQREAVADTLKRLGALAGVLILVLMGANVMLWLLLRRVQSDAEQIQAAQSHLSAIVSSSLDAVLVVDRIGGIVDYNGAAEAMFGYPREDILGCPLAKTLIGPTKKRQELTWIELKQNTAETGQARVELEAQRLDGALFPAEIAISRAELPHGPLYVLFVRDISEQRAAEADLRAARDTALQNERARARFMAVMSHEMRNPLNGIIGSLELIEDDELPSSIRKRMNVVRQCSSLLLRHINDVLDISRLDAGASPIQSVRFDLSEVVEDVAASIRPQAESSGNRLQLFIAKSVGVAVLGDPDRLRQILMNLVGNAAKFTQNGEIAVDVFRTGDGPEVEIQVIDTGQGIAEEDLDRVFDDFVTLGTPYDRAADGTGLGLGITRRLVTSMGGTISVESVLGEGSLFCVRLPMTKSEEPALSADVLPLPRETSPLHSADADKKGDLNVLLVEDSATNRTITADMLRQAGHRVTTAEDGAAGVAQAQAQPFDLILMDISMPRMDGVTATKSIRASGGPNAVTPILALTAHAMPEERARFMHAGMNAVLSKPIRKKTLIEALSQNFAPEPEGQPENLHSIDEVSLTELEESSGADRLPGLIGAFIRDTDTAIAVLSATDIENHADADVMSVIHRLSGSAALFGAMELHRECYLLEERGKTGSMREVYERLPDLARIWAGIRPYFITRKEMSAEDAYASVGSASSA